MTLVNLKSECMEYSEFTSGLVATKRKISTVPSIPRPYIDPTAPCSGLYTNMEYTKSRGWCPVKSMSNFFQSQGRWRTFWRGQDAWHWCWKTEYLLHQPKEYIWSRHPWEILVCFPSVGHFLSPCCCCWDFLALSTTIHTRWAMRSWWRLWESYCSVYHIPWSHLGLSHTSILATVETMN